MVLKGAGKRYGEREVLAPLDLTVMRGELVALMGPNGAGKSTLLRMIAQREQPSTGTLRLGQHVALSYYAQDQAEELGASGTVLDAVYTAAPGWTLEQVRREQESRMVSAFAKVYDLAQRRGVPMRTAAFLLAINRVARARVLGGI